MAGKLKINQLQLGDSATATQNFVLQTNVDGTAKLARGNAGATTQDVMTVDASGMAAFPQGLSIFAVLQTTNTLDTSAVHTIAHGLGAIPRFVAYRLVVTTAVAGWSIGDVIYKWIAISGTTEEHVSVGADATNIIITHGASTIGIPNKTTGANTGVSLSNFKMQVCVGK